MRSLTFTRVAILTAAFLTGCGSESSPTAESTPGPTAYAIAHNTADHFKAVDPVTFQVDNPCNGESITFTGTAESQVTFVDTREHLDAGNSLHTEFQQHTTAIEGTACGRAVRALADSQGGYRAEVRERPFKH